MGSDVYLSPTGLRAALQGQPGQGEEDRDLPGQQKQCLPGEQLGKGQMHLAYLCLQQGRPPKHQRETAPKPAEESRPASWG